MLELEKACLLQTEEAEDEHWHQAEQEEAAVEYDDGRRRAALIGSEIESGADHAYVSHGLSGIELGAEDGLEWSVSERTGNVPGRPGSGVTEAVDAERLIMELARPGRTLEQLRAGLRRGRPTEASRRARAELAQIVYELRGKATRDALAGVLQCDPATVWRLEQDAAPGEQAA